MMKDIISWVRGFFRLESPCHGEKMTSVLDMDIDKMVYTCPKCKKEWF